MSGTTNAVVILGGAMLLAPAALVVGAARGAGAVASALHQEYRRAREELEARAQGERERRSEAQRLHETQAGEVAGLAARTVVEPEADAAMLMLRHGVIQLGERLAATGSCQPEVRARYESFRARLAAGSGPVPDLVQEYGRLWADLARARDSATTTVPAGDSLAEDLAAMRDEIALGFPNTPRWRRVRESLAARVDDLERLAASEPAAARQASVLLSRRIHRELRECARGEEADRRAARQVRSLVADLTAKLTAVQAHPELPARVEQATGLMRRLGSAPGSGTEEYRNALLRLGAEVDELYQACEADLARREAGEAVGRHVRDALLALGYRVTVVPPGDSPVDAFIAPVTDGVGVEFSVGAGGQLRTEMVSLSESAVTAGAGAQERACALVEDVYRALRQRGAEVREKYRRHLAEGELLRRVVLAEREQGETLDAGYDGTLRRPVQ
ncbi:MAG: hypothetical protein RDU89_04685 [bacterium]|nr:hypothetical protein [bacterium]